MKVKNCVVELRSHKPLEFSTACIAEPNFDFVEPWLRSLVQVFIFHLSTFNLLNYQVVQPHLGHIVYSLFPVIGVALFGRDLCEAYLFSSLADGYDKQRGIG